MLHSIDCKCYIHYCMSSCQFIEIDSDWLWFMEKQHQKKKESWTLSMKMILKPAGISRSALNSRFKHYLLRMHHCESIISIFEVLYALLWVQDFFFRLRTTHFSWTIPKLSSIRYIKVQKKNPEHLKAKQNLQFFSILF